VPDQPPPSPDFTGPDRTPDRTLPDPGFAGDQGEADPSLAEALRRYAVDGRQAPVLVALSRARVLVPVVALLGEVEVDESGLARDKTADIAAVLMQGRDGRTALLAFTAIESLQAWRADARPVPVAVADAATAAVQEEAAAIVLDVAGPTTFVVEEAELAELAAGHVLIATSAGYAWLAEG
jgi:hypothetical protein